MVLCCLIPLAIIAVLWATGFSGSYLTLAVVLLCPILHLVMMFGMKKKPGDKDGLPHH
jgi:hypothetical protein